MPSIFSDPSSHKSNVYERSWSNLNKEEFILDYFQKIDPNHSFDNFLLNMNGLFDKHALFR